MVVRQKINTALVFFLMAILFLSLSTKIAYSEKTVLDPLDPFDSGRDGLSEENDDDKSAKELIANARLLLLEERPLDARTKLLKALSKDPKEYNAHILLAHYYTAHVGHFRLALKYIKQAQNLFEERFGVPPYSELTEQLDHAQILYFLHQIRLSLDNYQGALDILDEFARYYNFADWYPGSRAWVLMKLGRVQEAIQVARLGVMMDAERGRTLNMLGILLSMVGEREGSLQVFKDAITYELSLGASGGQPATPLNNSGEVYKEIFREDEAQNSWLKAIRLPDGCEHVLPSLNLALSYIDDLNFPGSKRAMDSFDACMLQYQLRNGEEHRALVHLARGRIDLHTGHMDSAIKHFEATLEHRQWFGKIGTNEADLRAAGLISLAQALRYKNNHLYFTFPLTITERVRFLKERLYNKIRARWLMRRASQVLMEELSNLEDLYVRNTDSMIEYPTFGEVLSGISQRAFDKRLAYEMGRDKRPDAKRYYDAYRAENLLAHGESTKALELINNILGSVRPRHDDLLKLHLLVLKLKLLDPKGVEYQSAVYRVFAASRAAVRNYGYRLPVNFAPRNGDRISDVEEGLSDAPFILDNRSKLEYGILYSFENGEYLLEFASDNPKIGAVKVKGSNLYDILNKFTAEVFTEDL